jgi:hypothetical protein
MWGLGVWKVEERVHQVQICIRQATDVMCISSNCFRCQIIANCHRRPANFPAALAIWHVHIQHMLQCEGLRHSTSCQAHGVLIDMM